MKGEIGVFVHNIELDKGYDVDAYLYLGVALDKDQFVEVVYAFFDDSLDTLKTNIDMKKDKSEDKDTKQEAKTSERDPLFDLREQAEKVVDLLERMDDTFPKYSRENAITVCMACINDAYETGRKHALDIC
ncbi:MAG: hypothetical protein U9O94_07005 [Nanoarchaeota archaeon]|nr:hypothetical protein [Nanoarchaeota archaeon]